jgi:hypothetical protein
VNKVRWFGVCWSFASVGYIPNGWGILGYGVVYACAMICVFWGVQWGEFRWGELEQVLVGNVDRAGWWE